jgi:hypothetical protein
MYQKDKFLWITEKCRSQLLTIFWKHWYALAEEIYVLLIFITLKCLKQKYIQSLLAEWDDVIPFSMNILCTWAEIRCMCSNSVKHMAPLCDLENGVPFGNMNWKKSTSSSRYMHTWACIGLWALAPQLNVLVENTTYPFRIALCIQNTCMIANKCQKVNKRLWLEFKEKIHCSL